MKLMRPNLKSEATWVLIIVALVGYTYLANKLYQAIPDLHAQGYNLFGIGLIWCMVFAIGTIFGSLGYGFSRLYVFIFDVWLLARKQTQRLKAEIFRIIIEFVGFAAQLYPHFNSKHIVQKQTSDFPLAKFASLSKIPYQLFPVSCILLN